MQALKKCNFKISPALNTDIDEIVLLHKKEIPSLLARLSIPLIRLYYSNARLKQELIFRVIYVNEMFGGFYLATSDKHITHFKIFFLRPWRLIKCFIISPISALLLVRSYIFKMKVPNVMSKSKLLYFGVTKNLRMKGIGRILINDLKATMLEVGEAEFGVHAEKKNKEAISFYKSVGGRVVGKFFCFGREIAIINFKTNQQ